LQFVPVTPVGGEGCGGDLEEGGFDF
jgi:hypothetical protein